MLKIFANFCLYVRFISTVNHLFAITEFTYLQLKQCPRFLVLVQWLFQLMRRIWLNVFSVLHFFSIEACSSTGICRTMDD